MANQRIAFVDGLSTKGSPHGLLIEVGNDDHAQLTIVGHDGKKRHATIVLPDDDAIEAAIAALRSAKARNRKAAIAAHK